MARPHPHNGFWLSVWRWFLRNPMLDRNQYGPIVDYIDNRKFMPVAKDDGSMEPLDPGFSMKRRDPLALDTVPPPAFRTM